MAPPSTVSKLALVCLVSSSVPSTSALTVAISAAQALGILESRQSSTCGSPNLSRCADAKLPSDFCCPSDSTCISLDSSSSALCCPKGADCGKIQPISCELSFQDVSARPDAAIKTTRLRDTLVTCGSDTCCPFGYSCDNNSQCVINKATSSTGGSSASPSASSTSTMSTTAPAGIDPSMPAPAGATPLCPRFPGAAVAVGFFPGMLAGALTALIAVICLGRHNTRDERPHSKGSGWSSIKHSNSHNRGRGAHGGITGISDPIPISQVPRTDFLRRQPSAMLRSGAHRAKSWFGSKSSPTFGDGDEKKASSLNPVSHWKMPTPPVPDNIPLATLGRTVPVTPPSQIRPSVVREPSTESIKIYSPPSMVRPPSESDFSPPPNRQHPHQQQAHHGLKASIMEKLSPFTGTELKARSVTISPPRPPANPNPNPDLTVNPPRRPGGTSPDLAAPPSQSSSSSSSFSNTATTATDPLPQSSSSHLHLPPQQQKQQQQQHHHHHHHPPKTNPPTPAALAVPAPSRPLTHMTTFTDVLRDAGLEPPLPPAAAATAAAAMATAAATASTPGGGGGGGGMPRALDWKGKARGTGSKRVKVRRKE